MHPSLSFQKEYDNVYNCKNPLDLLVYKVKYLNIFKAIK